MLEEDDPVNSRESQGGTLTALAGGARQTISALQSAASSYTGNTDAVVSQTQAASEIQKTDAQRAFTSDIQARSAQSDDTLLDALKNVSSAAWNNPRGAYHEMVAQLPNSAVAMGGMVAGAKAGGAIGATGGPVGAAIGTVVGGIAGMFLANTAIETGYLAQGEAADGEVSSEDLSRVRRQGATKAGVITGVDTLSMGVSRLLAGAPGRAVERAVTDTLSKNGVDVANEAAVRAALSTPELLQQVTDAGTLALAATTATGQRVARGAGSMALESTSEGAGEYLGSTAAGLDASPTEAVMESLMSVPQSAAEIAIAGSGIEAGRNTAIAEDVRSGAQGAAQPRAGARRQAPQASQASQAAPVATSASSAAQPEATPARKVTPDEIVQFAQRRMQELEAAAELTPAQEAEMRHIAQSGQNPQALASGYRVELVEAGNAGQATPDQPQAMPAKQSTGDEPVLQNRDRDTRASIEQMQKIAAKPDYALAGFSRLFSDGAPVVEPGVTVPDQQMGREDIATTAEGRKIPVRYAVVEASTLVPSHKADGTRVQQYDQQSPGMSRAVAGNGRIAGIQRAFEMGTAGEYVEAMAGDEALHGVPAGVINAMQRPVLVRIMPQEEISANIGDESNTRSTATLTPAEQAKSDARRVDVRGVEVSDDGEITQSSVMGFIQAMPQSERAGLLDNGKPNRQAYDRLNNLLFRQAFDSEELLRLQSEAVDPEVRTIMAALRIASAKLARLRDTGVYDVRGLVEEAAETAVNAKRSGEALANFIQQRDIGRNPEVEPILRMMAENIRSARKIADGLTALAELFYNESQRADEDMFGAVQKRTRSQLLGELYGDTGGSTNTQDTGERPGAQPPGTGAQGREAERSERAGPSETARDQSAGREQQGQRAVEKVEPEFSLQTQSEEELKQLQDQQDAKAREEAEAESKARADAERDTFALSGSSRPADVATSRGQRSLLDGINAAANQAATSAKNDLPQPTDAQKEAGNYKMGHISVMGMDITIENPKGSKRSGVDPDGESWSVTMKSHYGYIKRTTGADGENVDVFVGPAVQSDLVFVIDQVNPDRTFDEHKVMLGFKNREDAIAGYKANYADGWKVGPVTTMSASQFKEWLSTGDNTKPVSKEVIVKNKKPQKFAGKTLQEHANDEYRKKLAAAGIDATGFNQQQLEDAMDKLQGIDTSKGSDLLLSSDRPTADKKPKARKLSSVDRAENYYRPGRIVDGYSGKDKVIAFVRAPDGSDWSVQVQRLDKDGNPSGRIRTHSTYPSKFELETWEKSNPVPDNKRKAEPVTDAFASKKAASSEAVSVSGEQKNASEEYGSSNTLVSKERAAELRKKLQDKLKNQLNSGIDPEMLALGAELAAFHIEAGARKFTEFAKAIAQDLGVSVTDLKKYLRSWYNGARDLMEDSGIDVAGMDSPEQVRQQLTSLNGESSNDQRPDEGSAANSEAGQKRPAEENSVAAGRGGGGQAADEARSNSGRDDRGSGDALDNGSASSDRERSNKPVRTEKSRLENDASRDTDGGRGLPGSTGGLFDQRSSDEEIGRVIEKVPASKPVIPLDAPKSVTPANLSEIRAQMPFLTEGQAQDVAFAETRFSKPEGFGVLFTNGTGTGKTFSGLGVIKRARMAGKENILIVAPKQPIVDAWIKAGKKFFGIEINKLESIKDAGKGIVVTTYANLGDNDAVVSRDWDMVVADEAHYLSSAGDGSDTKSLDRIRELTLKRNTAMGRVYAQNRELVEKMTLLDQRAKSERLSDDMRDWGNAEATQREADAIRLQLQQMTDAEKSRMSAVPPEKRPRAVFLSATPFAYEKSVQWANEFLFDWGTDADSSGYNSGNNYERFMMQHFGYRMRYNKLTEPDAKVDRGLMQRAFNSWLKREGTLSGRTLDSDFDYDRLFVYTENQLGRRVDEAIEWLRDRTSGDNEVAGMSAIYDKMIKEKFDYHSRMYFLEAIKAREAVPQVRAHLALGRKVIVMHDFNKGGSINPFKLNFPSDSSVMPEARAAYEMFAKEFGDLIRAFDYMPSPIEQLSAEFPEAMIYNGTVSAKKRIEMQNRFNSDDQGSPRLMIAQGDAMREGVSIHDTSGKHQRVLIHLGMPTKPTAAIQQEGRIFRTGQASDAMFRYLTIGSNWERYAFASKIATRASAAENLAMGELARGLKDAFISAYENAGDYPPGFSGEGTGGKSRDQAFASALTPWDTAKTYYFGTKKYQSGRSARGREHSEFFATPDPLGFKMVQWADLRAGESALEPSAGLGAIARWFPDAVEKRAIEYSSDLASRLALHFDGDLMTGDFMDHHITNKYDAIVMNPPFGQGGKQAADHVEKAIRHLRDRGRVVALVPTGPAADKQFEKLLYNNQATKDVFVIADIKLPSVTFERAGTSVSTRILVLEKQTDEKALKSLQSRSMDLSSIETIEQLFDRVENLEMPARQVPVEEKAQPSPISQPMETWEVRHTKTGEMLYMAKPTQRLSREEFQEASKVAKRLDGHWSSFGRAGFLFKSETTRKAFVDAFSGVAISEPAEQYSAYEQPNSNIQGRQRDQNVVRQPRPDAGRGQLSLFLPEGIDQSDAREAYADLYGTIVAPRTVQVVRSAVDSITSEDDLAHLVAHLRKDPQENFLAIATGAGGKILRVMKFTRGTRDASSVYPLDVIAEAASIEGIETLHFAHNHPSGTTQASDSDRMVTDQIQSRLVATGINPGFHVIIAGTRYGSVASTRGRSYGVSGNIAPRARKHSVPITERRFVKRSTLDSAITGSGDAKAKTAKFKDSLVLLDNGHHPVAVIRMSVEEMKLLRAGGRVKRVLAAINKSNGASVIIRTNDQDAAINLSRMLNSFERDIKVLDWIDDAGRSDAEKGLGVIGQSGAFFSRPDDSTESAAFDEFVNKFESGALKPGQEFAFSGTPAVLRSLGAADLKLVVNAGVLQKAVLGKHKLSAESLRGIPQSIADPIMVFDSKTQPDSLVVLTELRDADAKPVVVAIHLDRKGRTAQINSIASIHGRPDGQIKQWIDEGLLAYRHKKKARLWSGSAPLQLRWEGVKNALRGRILTEADIEVNQGSADMVGFGESARPVRPASTFAQARQAAERFKGLPLRNADSGIVATVSRNNLDKMLSVKAVGKSETPELHSLAVANLDSLFEIAVRGWSKPDDAGGKNIETIHRFFAPIISGDKAYMAKLTVKETVQESRPNPLYTVEAVSFDEIKNPAAQWVGEIAEADGVSPRTIRSAGSIATMAQQIQNFNSTTKYYRPTRASTPIMPLESAEALVEKITGKYKNAPEVFVVTSMQDPSLPEWIRVEDAKRRSLEKNLRPPAGFYYRGAAYIVLEGISVRPGENAGIAITRVLSHEVLGHAGLQGVFRGSIESVLGEVALRRDADVRRKAKQYGLDMTIREERLLAAEEVLAEMAQSEPTNSLVVRAIEAIRKALQRLYLELPESTRELLGNGVFIKWVNGLSDAEIVDRFIAPARQYIKKGGQPGVYSRPAFSRPDPAEFGRSANTTEMAAIETLEMQARALSERVNAAYQEGNFELAEDLDAQLEDIYDQLEAALNELQEDGVDVESDGYRTGALFDETDMEASLEDDLARNYYDLFVNPNHYRRDDDTESKVATLRDIFSEFRDAAAAREATDEQILEAAEDAYERKLELRGRRKAGGSVRFSRAIPMEGGFSDSTAADLPFVGEPSAGFSAPDETLVTVAIRKIQDKFKVLKDLQSNIIEAGGTITEANNAYLAEELFHGKAENDLRQMEEQYIQPLAKKMAAFEITRDQLDLFLYAMHAPERNAYIASINPQMQDGGSGMTDAEAARILSDIRAGGKLQKYEQLAAIVYDMLQMQRDMIGDGGLESDTLMDVWQEQYRYYVPLKGWADDTKGEGRPGTGSGFNIRGREAKAAMGRESKAASPTSFTIVDLTEKIIRRRKNQVGNALLRMIQDNPNPEYWDWFTDEKPDMERRIVRENDPETGESVRRVRYVPVPMAMVSDRYFTTKKNGKIFYMKLNDERLMRAMKNLGPESNNGFIKAMAGITRFMSALNTSYSPEFMVSNFARDVQTALLNLQAEQSLPEGKGKASGLEISTAVIKGIPVSMRAIYASLRGKNLTGEAGQWQRRFDEFREDGAKTGWFDMRDLDGQSERLDAMVEMAEGGFKGGAISFAMEAGKFVESLNQAVENAVRLSAYVSAVDAGLSRKAAASLAKNMTVNFNRRGEVGTTLNALYMFANASTQGVANFVRTMGTLKGDGSVKWSNLNNAQRIAVGIVAGAYFVALANRAAAGDDDDGENWYDKVPDYVKERNLVLMKSLFGGPQDGSYWKIPLPYGYNVFSVLGESIEAAASGSKSPAEVAKNVSLSVIGSFSPIGYQDSETISGLLLKNSLPTVAKPIVEIGLNENFMGSTIYNENSPYGVQVPESTLGRRSTPEAYKRLSLWLNDVSGGNEFRPGTIDVNPDAMQHVLEYFGGSAYSFFGSKVPDFLHRATAGVASEDASTPFISRISGRVLPYADTDKFYRRREEIEQIREEYKSLSPIQRWRFDSQDRRKLELVGLMRQTENTMTLLRKQRDEIYSQDISFAERDRRLKSVEQRMKAAVDSFNKAYLEAQ